MIYISDLQQLVGKWQERVGSNVYPSSYKDGVMDCIYELNELINRQLIEAMTEEDARQYLLSQEADDYLSSMETHEYAAAV